MELVTGAVGILLPKLATLLKEEYGLRTGVKEKIKSLSNELEMVQAVLREVGDVPWDQLDEPVRLWVHNLREASYDMEDIVDSFLVRVGDTKTTDPHMLERQRKKVGFRKKVGKLCKKIEGFWACREISCQIQDITKKLEELASMRNKYDLSHFANSTAAKTIDPRILNLHKMAKELVGIDGPRDDLIDKLSVMGDVDGSDEKTKVVSIVGFGGLGKTTLAKAVYDQLKPRFECTAFVPVGQKPDMKQVLRDILIDLDKEKYMKSDIMLLDEKQLIDELKKFVKEKSSTAAVHKLWDWERSDTNPLGKATTSVAAQLRQPKNGIVMTNDTSGNPEEATACYALSRNNCRLISASGGKIREFDMYSFEIKATIVEPPPAATFLTFYSKGNNITAIGMDDSSIQIYDLQIHEVKKVLMGHTGKITGLAFSQSMDVLVSSGSDAQLCVWSIEGWEIKASRYIQPPSNCSDPLVGDTMVQFHPDQTHLLVVHESQLGIYNGTLECLRSWFPRDSLPAPVASAVHSADGLLVYAGFRDGAIGIFEVESLMLRCRIAPSAYIPSSVSSGDVIVYPMVVAANPWRTNQIAVGMSDGAVYVLEPLDTDMNIGIGASGQHLSGDNISGTDDSLPDA